MLSTPSIVLLSSLVAYAVARSAERSVFSPSSNLHRRGLTGQNIAFACFGGGGDCECPSDLHGDSGVLINVYPGFQCAYPNGACTWEDKVGYLRPNKSCNSTDLLRPDRSTGQRLPDELSQFRAL